MKAFTTIGIAWLAAAAMAAPRDAPICPADEQEIAHAFIPRQEFTAFQQGQGNQLVEVTMRDSVNRDGVRSTGIRVWNNLPEPVVVDVHHNLPNRGVNHPGALVGSVSVEPGAHVGNAVNYWFPQNIPVHAALLFTVHRIHRNCG